MAGFEGEFKTILNKDYYSDILELSDGKLRTEDGFTFNIHRIELVKSSNYFYRLFCGPIGKGKVEFLIPGIKGEVLENILSYISNGSIHVTDETVAELLVGADYLLLENLIMHIQKIYMRDSLSIDNCLTIFVAALEINRPEISRKCFRYIQTHFETVVTKEESGLGKLPLEALKHFLGTRSLCVKDETAVWTAIVKWVQTDTLHRQCLVPDLLMHVDISDVNDELALQILEHDIIVSNPFCSKIDCLFLRQSSSSGSHLDILKTYIEQSPNTVMPSCNSRGPEYLHFIAHYHSPINDCLDIYVTYDENIDLWRKILHDFNWSAEFILCTDFSIYIYATSSIRNFRFNLIDKTFSIISDFCTPRKHYVVAELDGFMYVLGGITKNFGVEIYDVEVYDPDEDLWSKVSEMMSVTSYSAATLGKRLYVIGNSSSLALQMMAQSYCGRSDEWIAFTPPIIFRFNFALVSYRGRLYVIGGANDEYLKNVEVFDPATEKWSSLEDLPHIFHLPKAIVLENALIVYENDPEDRKRAKMNPAVLWDDEMNHWKVVEESSPLNTLHEYCFFNPGNEECMKRISRENRDPKTEFLKSPFS